TLIHLTFLHESRWNNPLGIVSNCDEIPLHPYFSLKANLGFIFILIPLITLPLF
ncbi:CYB protein, partial [Glareola pratincola]|nr:CYB protein [Glareola pratincola]